MTAAALTVSKLFSLHPIIRNNWFAASPRASGNAAGIITAKRFAPIPSMLKWCRKAGKWRDALPHYQQKYRERHSEAVERNRQQQQVRDQRHRLQHLVKNSLALNLRHSSAEIWLLGPAADGSCKEQLGSFTALDSSAG